MMKFNMPKEQSSIIKVVGVGGGGSNAVNHMYELGIKGVDFVICNTDAQALDISPVPVKIQLGASLTEGRGAGSIPDVGKNAAIENIDDIKEILANNTKMVFVTAGMGGGTGTGAAPVIAKVAKEMGILTVGIVTVPFSFEGRKRKAQAEAGIESIREAVDTLLIINNDRLREMFGNLTLQNAFAQADQVLSTAAKGIAEVISVTGQINVDFNDVNTVMRDSGVAIMGSAVAEGENRALRAVEEALSSPLLNDNDIMGARYVLLNITYGSREVLMDEISDITDYIQDEAGMEADVIWGHGQDDDLGDKLCITLIATGFKATPDTGIPPRVPERVKRNLDEEVSTNITAPIDSPTQSSLPTAEAPGETGEPEPYVREVEAREEVQEESVTPELKTEEVASELQQTPPPIPTNELNLETATDEVVEPSASEETQSSFSFDLTDTTNDKSTDAVEDTTETSGSEVTRYVLEDDMEESTLDTWVDSGIRQSEPVQPTSGWEESKEEKEEWQPILKSEEAPKAETSDEPEQTWEPEVKPSWTVDAEASDDNEQVERNEESEETAQTQTGFNWNPEPAATPQSELSDDSDVSSSDETVSKEDQEQLAEERIARIKKISLKLKTPSGIADLEGEPAYKRRNIQLDDVQPSNESNASRLSLGENEEGKSGLSSGNSFLHDNVD